jgi:pimeloyl-ACP methyl ester carboxylesterase
MKALFVRGFNTYMTNEYDRYHSIKTFLESRNISVDYINYSTDRDIYRVYEKIGENFEKENYDYLIGHSMGGCLVTRFMYDHPEKIKSLKKIILLMPLIYKDPLTNIALNIPFMKSVKIPKPILIQEIKLYNEGNILNDRTLLTLLPLTQIADCYNKLMLPNNRLVKTLNKENCILFFAMEEMFSSTPQHILDEIKYKHIISGKHESFNDMSHAYNFFEMFGKIL